MDSFIYTCVYNTVKDRSNCETDIWLGSGHWKLCGIIVQYKHLSLLLTVDRNSKTTNS